MRTAYQYRLLPTKDQQARMVRWLDMLRCQYNYLLSERFQWWEVNRCSIHSCSLVSCFLPELKDRPEYYNQKRSLVPMKAKRPWYQDVCAETLQEMVKRVDLAFQRFVSGDSQGKRSGKPRFKGKGRYRSFAFPQLGAKPIRGNRVVLPKLGEIKFIQHRPLPEGFVIKTASVSLKADGWYVTLSLEDKSVPSSLEVEAHPTEQNSIGIDAGLQYFVACSDGSTKQPPKFLRQAERKLATLQAKIATKPKRSKSRRKLCARLSRIHQKITRQRKQWHYETAGEMLSKADVLFVERLRVSNMTRRNKAKQDSNGTYLPNGQAAKSGRNKSFADAGIARFLNEILPYKAEKAGKRIIHVNPAGTSQHCANCLNRVPKELSDRWHDCPQCGVSMPRDINSALLIKKVGLGIRLTIKREGRKTGEARTLRKA